MPPPAPASDATAPDPEAGASGTPGPAEKPPLPLRASPESAPPQAARRGSPPQPALAARLRQAHAAAAPWLLTPLLLTVCTGMGYRLLRDWGGLNRDQAHLLMVLHEGEWLRRWFGSTGETLYVLLNGLGLLWMLASGGAMLAQRLRRPLRRRAGVGSPERLQ